jgi:hypothetical protein
MTGADLLANLRHAGLAIRADGDALFVRPRELLTDDLRTQIREHKPAILAALQDAANDAPKQTDAEAAELQDQDDPAAKARRQRVLAILTANPGFRYAVVTDTDAEPGAVVVQIGIRGVGSGEIVVASANYDGIVLLKALEAHQP